MVDLRLCTEREVAKALALVLDLDFVDLTTDPLLPNVARLLPQTCERQVEVAMVMCRGARATWTSVSATGADTRWTPLGTCAHGVERRGKTRRPTPCKRPVD